MPNIQDTYGEVEWLLLRPHLMKDSLIVVNQELDLLTVAKAVAENQVDQIGQWIQEGKVGKPTAAQISTWDQNGERRFYSVVVMPFVLIQELRQH